MGGGAIFYDCLVEVEVAPPAAGERASAPA